MALGRRLRCWWSVASCFPRLRCCCELLLLLEQASHLLPSCHHLLWSCSFSPSCPSSALALGRRLRCWWSLASCFPWLCCGWEVLLLLKLASHLLPSCHQLLWSCSFSPSYPCAWALGWLHWWWRLAFHFPSLPSHLLVRSCQLLSARRGRDVSNLSR